MEAIAVIGIDLAKSVFQVHCVDAQGEWLCANGCWKIASAVAVWHRRSARAT